MRDGRRSRFADGAEPGSCQGGQVNMPFVGHDQVAAARRCVDEDGSRGVDDQGVALPSSCGRAVDAHPAEERDGYAHVPRDTVSGRSRQPVPLDDGLLSVWKPTVVRRA
jgi:hypothetical protein